MYQLIIAVLGYFVIACSGFSLNKVIIQDIGTISNDRSNIVGFIALETPEFVQDGSKLHQESYKSVSDISSILQKVFYRINTHLKINISDLTLSNSLQNSASVFGTKTFALKYDEEAKQLIVIPKSQMGRAVRKIANHFHSKGVEAILKEVQDLNQAFDHKVQVQAEEQAKTRNQRTKNIVENNALGFWTIKYQFNNSSERVMNVKIASNKEYYVINHSLQGNWELEPGNKILRWRYSSGGTVYEGKLETDREHQLKIQGTIDAGSTGKFTGFKVSNTEAKKILYKENSQPKIFIYDDAQNPSEYTIRFSSDTDFTTDWFDFGGEGTWDFTGDKFTLNFRNGKKIELNAEFDSNFMNYVGEVDGRPLVVKWLL